MILGQHVVCCHLMVSETRQTLFTRVTRRNKQSWFIGNQKLYKPLEELSQKLSLLDAVFLSGLDI